jgi:hypothetical protein
MGLPSGQRFESSRLPPEFQHFSQSGLKLPRAPKCLPRRQKALEPLPEGRFPRRLGATRLVLKCSGSGSLRSLRTRGHQRTCAASHGRRRPHARCRQQSRRSRKDSDRCVARCLHPRNWRVASVSRSSRARLTPHFCSKKGYTFTRRAHASHASAMAAVRSGYFAARSLVSHRSTARSYSSHLISRGSFLDQTIFQRP